MRPSHLLLVGVTGYATYRFVREVQAEVANRRMINSVYEGIPMQRVGPPPKQGPLDRLIDWLV